MTAPRESSEFVDQIALVCGDVGRENFTFVNVGALDGWEASQIARKFPRARVVAIEAHPLLAAAYRDEFSNIEYHWGIIGEKTGPCLFYGAAQPGLSSLHDRGGQVFLLESTRLDEWCRRHDIGHIDVLFIDTEGNDYEVLAGAGGLLTEVSAVIAEAQTTPLYQGGRLLGDIDAMLGKFHLHRRPELGYSAGVQGNYFWTRRAGNTRP